MVFSISNRIIFTPAYCLFSHSRTIIFTSTYCLFSHSRMKIVITQNHIAIHIVITELACPLEHVNCINYINITVLRPWKQIFWNFKEAHDQTYNYFRWEFSIIVTKLWIYLMQLIQIQRRIFSGHLWKGIQIQADARPLGILIIITCKINVLEMEVLLLLTIK